MQLTNPFGLCVPRSCPAEVVGRWFIPAALFPIYEERRAIIFDKNFRGFQAMSEKAGLGR